MRAIAPTMTGDIVVQLAGGTYALTAPLTFTSADSGPTATPCSGRPHRAHCPSSPAGSGSPAGRRSTPREHLAGECQRGFDTRQLYVNGRIATRARTQFNRGDFTSTTTGMTFTNGALSYLNNVAAEDRIELESVNSFTDRYV